MQQEVVSVQGVDVRRTETSKSQVGADAAAKEEVVAHGAFVAHDHLEGSEGSCPGELYLGEQVACALLCGRGGRVIEVKGGVVDASAQGVGTESGDEGELQVGGQVQIEPRTIDAGGQLRVEQVLSSCAQRDGLKGAPFQPRGLE